jgi:hypothetical protein
MRGTRHHGAHRHLGVVPAPGRLRCPSPRPNPPAGGLVHSAGFAAGARAFRIFDVWEPQAAWEACDAPAKNRTWACGLGNAVNRFARALSDEEKQQLAGMVGRQPGPAYGVKT